MRWSAVLLLWFAPVTVGGPLGALTVVAPLVARRMPQLVEGAVDTGTGLASDVLGVVLVVICFTLSCATIPVFWVGFVSGIAVTGAVSALITRVAGERGDLQWVLTVIAAAVVGLLATCLSLVFQPPYPFALHLLVGVCAAITTAAAVASVALSHSLGEART